MRILQIIDSLAVGGAERLLVEIVPKLIDKKHQVDVLLLSGVETQFLKKLRLNNNCKIYVLGENIYDLRHVFKMRNYFKNYDVIHVHLFPAQYFAAIAKILFNPKVPLIFTEHSTSNSRLKNKIFWPFEKLIARQYQKIICITDAVLNQLKNVGVPVNKLIVINNGINLEEIHNSTPSEKEHFFIAEGKKLIVMVAGFREEKDQETVISALSLLPENYYLILVGDGIRRNVIENHISKLKLNDRVLLTGVRNDVYSIIKMANIAVLSSHWEGFGLVAAEAMACGTPLIASNVSGLAEVVSGGGVLFEKGNCYDLCEKILELEDPNYSRQILNQGLQKALEFDLNKMIDKIEELYKNVLLEQNS